MKITNCLQLQGRWTVVRPRLLRVILVSVVLVFGSAACSAKRPALYENQKTASVSPAQIQMDIDDCIALARSAGHSRDQGTDAAVSTTTGAATGAAIGAATGAVRGNAGRGAATGAAGGAVAGLVRSMFHSRDPDPIERNYVDECLRRKGYTPIGWQ